MNFVQKSFYFLGQFSFVFFGISTLEDNPASIPMLTYDLAITSWKTVWKLTHCNSFSVRRRSYGFLIIAKSPQSIANDQRLKRITKQQKSSKQRHFWSHLSMIPQHFVKDFTPPTKCPCLKLFSIYSILKKFIEGTWACFEKVVGPKIS